MKQKSTEDLENILQNTHNGGLASYLEDNAEEMVDEAKPFSAYMHQIIKRNGLTQQDVFLAADFPERYGYKLLAEEKRTKQRDYILRICYAANMTLDETQRALALYGMGKLYARIPRDAVLMVAFNQHKGSILDVNALLAEHKMDTLRTCGNLE